MRKKAKKSVTYITRSETETKKVARAFAEEALKTRVKKALVIALSGDLGAGKTVFVRGFLRACGVRGTIASPSFVLMRSYPVKGAGAEFSHVFHFDLYRLEDAKVGQELRRLGWKDAVADSKNIILVEWADKARRSLPKEAIHISLRHGEKENERVVRIES